jgi:ribonuclease P protein component
MGFFKKLFEKKDCEICGGEIGLLGNRKLVDGDMCKKCAAKLSPWFEDRKESTVAQIKEQLAYREANAAAHGDFRPTKTLGEYYKMYVMEENGCPTKFVVSIADNYADANADHLAGVVVSKKTFHDAVVRNRAKRLMREAFRLLVKEGLAPEHTEWIFIARHSIKDKKCQDVIEDMKKIWSKM